MNEKRFLFVVDNLPPSTSANGICVNKIINSLKKRYYVACLTLEKNYESNNYDYETFQLKKETFENKGNRIHNIIKKYRMLPYFPVQSLNRLDALIETICQIISEKKITDIVAVSFPGESLFICKKIKEKYQNINYILYPLDVSSEGSRSKRPLYKYLSNYYGRKNLKNAIASADGAILLENSLNEYRKFINDINNPKYLVAGIPLIQEYGNYPIVNVDDNLIFMYAGNMESSMYNPIPLLDKLERDLGDLKKTAIFDFYGVSDKRLDNTIIKRYKNIKYRKNGWVSEETLRQAEAKAFCFINIAKTVTDTIPSKVFKYMCTKKPIIHFYYRDSDPCLSYLERYGAAFLIKKGERYDAINIVNEIEKLGCVNTDLKSLFKTCVPEYTANLIGNFGGKNE